jgi:hypothetical protein
MTDDLPRVGTDITALGPVLKIAGTDPITIHLAAGDLIVTLEQLDSLASTRESSIIRYVGD